MSYNTYDTLEWKNIQPKEWTPDHYKKFIMDLKIDEILFRFHNSIYVTKQDDENNNDNKTNSNGKYQLKSEGFRACSFEPSMLWAKEKKFLVHKCSHKKHRYTKHSILSEDFPLATWICPETNAVSHSPFRYNPAGTGKQICFKNLDEIRNFARKPRTWYWEMTLQKSEYMGKPIFSKKFFNNNEDIYDQQWNRAISHPYIIEVDSTKQDNHGRRDMLCCDSHLQGAQEFINTINDHMENVLNINSKYFEWWFSGNGLYWILNPFFNSTYIKSLVPKYAKLTVPQYFKRNLAYWDAKLQELVKLTDNIKYVKIDNHSQHLRAYIKDPFSLHNSFDRLCIPNLAAIYGKNDRIDLTKDGGKKLIEISNPNKLTDKILEKYFTYKVEDYTINNFMESMEVL